MGDACNWFAAASFRFHGHAPVQFRPSVLIKWINNLHVPCTSNMLDLSIDLTYIHVHEHFCVFPNIVYVLQKNIVHVHVCVFIGNPQTKAWTYWLGDGCLISFHLSMHVASLYRWYVAATARVYVHAHVYKYIHVQVHVYTTCTCSMYMYVSDLSLS